MSVVVAVYILIKLTQEKLSSSANFAECTLTNSSGCPEGVLT